MGIVKSSGSLYYRPADRVVKAFNMEKCRKNCGLPLIVVFSNPQDYPGKWIARLFDTDKPTQYVAVADTYDDLLAAIPTGAMARIQRDPADDPVIVETWI